MLMILVRTYDLNLLSATVLKRSHLHSLFIHVYTGTASNYNSGARHCMAARAGNSDMFFYVGCMQILPRTSEDSASDTASSAMAGSWEAAGCQKS